MSGWTPELPFSFAEKYIRQWSLQKVKSLCDLVEEYCRSRSIPVESLTLEDFALISQSVGQSPTQCMIKFRSVIISGSLKPGVWSKPEDDLLKNLVSDNLSWKEISYRINSIFHGGLFVRNPKQCSERWNNHLNPLIKKGPWGHWEDNTLFEGYRKLGNAWDTIALMIGSRTGSSVKNRFNSLVNKERKKNPGLTKEDATTLLVQWYSQRT